MQGREKETLELLRQRLKQARADAGLTQKELGDIIGLSERAIQSIESITVMRGITLCTLLDIAYVTDVSMDWLFGRTDKKGIIEVEKIVKQNVVKKFFNPNWGDDVVEI